ncbi:MAG: hypothetical protein AAGA42_02440 [Actinomycetota bacterium]
MGETAALERVVDYGLGSYKGKPLVLVNRDITIYHRHDHSGRLDDTTFTEDFVRNDWDARPCKVCFP